MGNVSYSAARGKKAYCAICKKEIRLGESIYWFTDENGFVKWACDKCGEPKDNNDLV